MIKKENNKTSCKDVYKLHLIEKAYYDEKYLIRKLSQKTPIYGNTPDDIFLKYKSKGLEILAYESKITKIHKMRFH